MFEMSDFKSSTRKLQFYSFPDFVSFWSKNTVFTHIKTLNNTLLHTNHGHTTMFVL